MARKRKEPAKERVMDRPEDELWYMDPAKTLKSQEKTDSEPLMREAEKTEKAGRTPEKESDETEGKKEKNPNEGHRARMRRRFREEGGFDGFSEHEVLELLLAYATPRRDTKTLRQGQGEAISFRALTER